jgi:thioredoxin reductase (NADPH)
MVRNYPGLPDISGADLLDKLRGHAEGMGADIIIERVSSVIPADGGVGVSRATDVSYTKAVILALGASQPSVFPGETELLGRGVSYCATCDGMFFRGKRVCVIMHAPDAESEAEYLESIGCEVVRLTPRDVTINGARTVESVTADGETVKCDGVFILRHTIAPASLAAGVELRGGHIGTDEAMLTSLPGIFAAGDCTGAPYQIAKAVGQGQIAALSAAGCIDGGRIRRADSAVLK